MLDKMNKILSKVDADYADIRYEEKNETDISFSGKELKGIGENFTDGFVIRVLKNGGFSSVVFTRPEDADEAIKNAIEYAELMGEKSNKPVNLKDVEVVQDEYSPKMKEDPRKISIDEKFELLKKYNDLALKHEKIVNTDMRYFEMGRKRYFISTEGARIKEDLITTGIRGGLISSDGNIIQNVRLGAGGSDGFYHLRNLEEIIEKRKKIVVDLLKAKPVEGGTYNCILNPDLTGVFTHEAFGHFSEADIVEDLPALRKKMQLNNKLGNDIVNIVDDPTIKNELGYYKYDDEGVKSRRVQLMKNGVLTGRLHSRRTAAEFDEPVTGHCVAEDYRYAPIVRMGTIFIEPQNDSFEDLLKKLGDGIYVCDAKGGQTSGENFTFGAQYGYLVKNGKVKDMVRDINISGNLYKTLKNIRAVGKDHELSKTGGCGKGQTNIRSCHGGPHTIIDNLIIGGV